MSEGLEYDQRRGHVHLVEHLDGALFEVLGLLNEESHLVG